MAPFWSETEIAAALAMFDAPRPWLREIAWSPCEVVWVDRDAALSAS